MSVAADAPAQTRFLLAERTLVDWWELQPTAAVLHEYGEWFVEIDGHRYSISEQAFAIAQVMNNG